MEGVEYRKSEGCGGKEIWDKSRQDAEGRKGLKIWVPNENKPESYKVK